MKYRSYNSEFLIATTLMCDVFNDVIIDRRKHGLSRDWSKAITLKDIVQQKIEVPCIIGDRGIILKSLENEPGKYKLPLIIIQMKDMKTDTARMCDIHADIFYQQDRSFSKLDTSDSRYRPQEISKRRGQPINISYDVTFIAKYKEDLDQIITNFAVFFKPDIYLKWWHPRNKVKPLTSQLTWGHSVSFDSNVDFQPTNQFVYKGSTSFTFKTWLFFGMDATDNTIDPNLESVIKHIKIFPNRTGEDQDMNPADSNNDDATDAYVFGDIPKTDEGTMGFWTVDNDQELIGNDPDKMKNGDYAVNNVFASQYPEISGDTVISAINTNQNVGDFMSNYDRWLINDMDEYQKYMQWDTKSISIFTNAFVKNIFFKGSFPQSSMFADPPSGDFMFRKFFSQYVNPYGKEKKSEFGSSFLIENKQTLTYNPETKDLRIDFEKGTMENSISAFCNYNSQNEGLGYVQEFHLQSNKFLGGPDDFMSIDWHYEFDKDLNPIAEKVSKEYRNIASVNDLAKNYEAKLFIEDYQVLSNRLKLRNLINSHWKAFNLMEKPDGIYWIEIEDPKIKKLFDRKEFHKMPWRSLKLVKEEYLPNNFYQVLTNKYIYIVLKINSKNNEECDIYDWGILFPLTFAQSRALLYEVTMESSKELLGLNMYIGI